MLVVISAQNTSEVGTYQSKHMLDISESPETTRAKNIFIIIWIILHISIDIKGHSGAFI